MMRFCLQFQYTLKRMFLDLRPLLNKIISGIIVILILGLVFKSSFAAKELEQLTVLYVNQDEGVYSQRILTDLRENENVSEILLLEEVESVETGKQMVEDKEASGLIIFNSDFSEKYADNTGNCVIDVYCSSYSGNDGSTDGKYVKTILDSYMDVMSAVTLAYTKAPELASGTIDIEKQIEEYSVMDEEKSNSMQYYAISMVIMLILTGMIDSGHYVAEEYFDSIGERIKISPMGALSQYFGKICGVIVMIVIEAVFMILFTKMFYGVDWGTNYLWLLIVIAVAALFAAALGATITIILGTDIGVEAVCPTIVYASTFFAGGYIAHDFGFFKYITPNYYVKVAINALVYDREMSIVYNQVGSLLVVTLAIAAVGIIVAGRKKA